MRQITIALFALALTACGGTPQRAPMPDVASTDQSADDMGLPSVGGSDPADTSSDAPAASATPE